MRDWQGFEESVKDIADSYVGYLNRRAFIIDVLDAAEFWLADEQAPRNEARGQSVSE